MKFKVGDRVRIKDDANISASGGEYKGRSGTIKNIGHGGWEKFGVYWVEFEEFETYGVWFDELIKEEDMNKFNKGDVLTSDEEYSDDLLVQGYIGDVLLAIDDDEALLWTEKELERDGYRLKDETVKELTLEQVAKLANVPVEQLRIKE